jgi:hypothetical protein
MKSAHPDEMKEGKQETGGAKNVDTHSVRESLAHSKNKHRLNTPSTAAMFARNSFVSVADVMLCDALAVVFR